MNFAFETVAVKQEVVNAFTAALPTFGFASVKVLTSDPQSIAEMPCIGVNRVSDDETNTSIADSNGGSYNATTKVYSTQQGTFFSEAVEIRVWHTNADERDKLYQVVKGILFAYRQVFVEKGLLNVNLRGGRDEQDSSMDNAPQIMYWSVITMTYLNPLDVEIYETAEPITAVANNGTITG